MIKLLAKVASASFVAAILTFFYQAYLTHALTVENNGVFSRWLTSIGYLELVYIMGLDSALMYFTRLGKNILVNIIRNIIVYTIILIVLLIILFSFNLNIIYYGTLIFTVYFMAVISSVKAYYQLKEMFKIYNFLSVLRPFLIAFFLVGYPYFIKEKITWEETVTLYLVSFGVNLIVSLFLFFRNIEFTYVKIKIFELEYFKYGWKGIFNKILSLLLYAMDIYLISYFLGDQSVAYYFIAVAISKLSWLVTDASGNILYPKFIKIKDKKTEEEAIKYMYFLGTINLLINLLALVVFYFIGKLMIVLIYEKSYLESYLPALILLMGSQGMAYYKLLGRYFASNNNWRPLYVALILGVISNLLLNYYVLAFTDLKLIGVATASAISYWICGISISFFKKGSFFGFVKLNDVIGYIKK